MRGFLALAFALVASGCASAPQQPAWCSAEAVRRDAEALFEITQRATYAEDIDAYMSAMPDELRIDDTSGEIVDREQWRADVLRDWAVITETLALENNIESITMNGCESAELIVNQRWERMMMRPNGVEGTDRILTTQRHRETWRHTERGWQGGEVEELGGDVYVNGEYYQPN